MGASRKMATVDSGLYGNVHMPRQRMHGQTLVPLERDKGLPKPPSGPIPIHPIRPYLATINRGA